MKTSSNILCIDLDGSLIPGDMLYESLMGLLRKNPLKVFLIPAWLFKGRAYLKQQLSIFGNVEISTLPFHNDVIDYLRERKAQGIKLVLATASDEKIAKAIADHLQLFDEVIASNGAKNLKGLNKLQAIVERFGSGSFDYLGNGWEDLQIWKSSGHAIAVQPSPSLLTKIHEIHPKATVFAKSRNYFKSWLKMIRVHQWAKNILVFVPLILAHQILDFPLILACFLAYFAFSFGASSIYIINDLLDLPSDRLHSLKHKRPLASCAVSIPNGLVTSIGLLLTSLALGFCLPWNFLPVLFLYLITSISYTFILKKKLMVDVICLASLYTIRILGGGAACSITISTWLFAFSIFWFLSLAFVKRYTELAESYPIKGKIPGRGYYSIDLDMIRSVGPTSGYLAILVVCLYLNDQASLLLYCHPRRLLFLCPIMLYWISRVWFLAQRQQMPGDPVVFALKDGISFICFLCCAVIILLASVF